MQSDLVRQLHGYLTGPCERQSLRGALTAEGFFDTSAASVFHVINELPIAAEDVGTGLAALVQIRP
jgi:hypothetical protein